MYIHCDMFLKKDPPNVAQADLELVILLCQPPECCDFKSVAHF